MTTTTPIPSAARLAEIEQRLNALGDVAEWRTDVHPQSGDELLFLPSRFLWQEIVTDGVDNYPVDGIWLGNLEGMTAEQNALNTFLGDAPHAIRDLLALVAQVRKLTNSALLPSEQVLAIRELLREGQRHA